MARIRSVKPEFWADEDLAQVSRDARLLYIGLWNLADEHARLRGDPRFIKGQLFPYDDDLTPAALDLLLDELARAGKAVRYRLESSAYVFLPNLAKHQRLEADKVPSKLPAPSDPGAAQISLREPAPRPNGVAPHPDSPAPAADSSTLLYGSGSMEPVAGDGGAPLVSAQTAKRGTRIPVDFAVTPEMVAWATKECPHVDGRLETEKFVNHWRAKTGKDATKLDWPATWRNWMLNARDRYGGARASPNGSHRDQRVAQVDDAVAAVKAKMQNGVAT